MASGAEVNGGLLEPSDLTDTTFDKTYLTFLKDLEAAEGASKKMQQG